MKKRYLVLSDGSVYEGEAFGADVQNIGELVFTTGMCGYIETLTDPSYYGQIVLQTFPLIGNYGIIPSDFEGQCCVKGYVVREYCTHPSNFRCEKTLDDYLKEQNIPGICSVDTRAITKKLREEGVMNAYICDSVPEDLADIKNYIIKDAVESVSCKVRHVYPAETDRKYSVALIDYGAKKNIIRELQNHGCDVTVFPCTVKAEELLTGEFDGVMLSNGPGDPADNVYQIEQIAKIFGRIPMFGICLGHQLTALSQNGKTVKLKYGHRGVNQPVKDVTDSRVYITSQNHGYAVVPGSVKNGTERFLNANDNTVEGMDYPGTNVFTVQFHPEACSGPHDTEFLFDRFCDMMGGEK
jgi:carbamoyl-phosphate synthase small subunit